MIKTNLIPQNSNEAKKMSIHPGTEIGHVHLKVSDLERSVNFYTEVLGFYINDMADNSVAFLSANLDEHHQIALNT